MAKVVYQTSTFRCAVRYCHNVVEVVGFGKAICDEHKEVKTTMSNFTLVDDGTLDTVVQCNRCGGQERFNLDVITSTQRVMTALRWAEEEHECGDIETCKTCGDKVAVDGGKVIAHGPTVCPENR